MDSRKQTINKEGKATTKNLIIAGITLLLAVAFFMTAGNEKKDQDNLSVVADLVISKNEMTETIKFYPIKIGKTNMEILALKASDGTIRTAFNTCQVCNGSPYAYYKQEGDSIVCQNCGNQFSLDMIEQVRGGCNPIPIGKEDKTEDENNITLSGDYILKNKDLFSEDWKTEYR